MKEERDSGMSAIGSLVDPELSPPFRDLIHELQRPAGGPHLDFLRSKILDTQTRIIDAQYLQHEENKRTLVGFRDVWKYFLPSGADRRRAGESVQDKLYLLAHPTLTRQLEGLLVSVGHSVRRAQRVAFDRSVSSHWLLAMLAIARWMTSSSHLDGVSASRSTKARV